MPTLLLLTPSLFFVHRKSPIFLSHCPAPLGDLPSGPSLSPWITSCRYPLHARGFKTEEEAREETVVAQQTKKNRTPRKKNMPPLYLLQNAGASLWAPKGAVGVVTGANKGIGLEIAAGLAANGLPVIATARSEERGRAAVEAIKSRAETEAEVSFLQLDVASDASVSEFARKLRGAAPAGVAVLVNNAAIAFKGQTWGGDEAEETVNTNYRGTRRVTEAVLPLLVEGGRVVNVCSRSGQLQRLFGGGGGNGGGGSGSGGGSPRPPPPPHTLPLNSNLSVSLSPTLEARPDLLHARPRPVLLQGKQREIRRQKPPRRLCPLPRVRQDGHELASGVEDARGRGGHGRVAVAGARGAAERALLRGEGGDRLLKKGEKEERCFFFFLSFLRGKGE